MSNEDFTSNSFFVRITHLIYRQREYSNTKQILQEIAQEAQRVLQVDRVNVYQFANDESCEVVAESVKTERLPSLLGLHFPDIDIPIQTRQSFLKFNKGVAIDVTAKIKIAYTEISTDNQLASSGVFDTEVIYQKVDHCHIQYLLTMGVLSSLVIPLFYWDDLWGLLVAHHSEPRRFQEQELVFMQLLSKQISLALNQEALILQSEYEQKQRYTLGIINQIWWDNQGSNAQAWSSILNIIVEQLDAEDGLVCIAPDLIGKPAQLYYQQKSNNLVTKQEEWIDLIKKISTISKNQENSQKPIIQYYTKQELINKFECQQLLDELDEKIHSFLFINLHQHLQWLGCVILFRYEQEWDILWAGQKDLDSRNYRSRQSFATWCEKQKGSSNWNVNELRLADKIAKFLYTLLTQERTNNLIYHQVNYDGLTQLPNQQIFIHQLNISLVKAIEQGQMLGIVMLDLNQFKKINESLGHTVGDYLLKQVAGRIKEYLDKKERLNPLLARWHGDRFVILFHQLNYTDELIDLCQGILEIFKNPFYFQNHIVDLGASLGVTIAPYDGDRSERVIRNVETAMYQAKTQGKNTFHFYNTKETQQDFNWLTLAADLRRAIIREGLTVYYQPQVSLKTRKITGVEALARWFHPKYGWISPAKFIPLAEEIGIIQDLGEWVLKTACEQHRLWEMSGLPILRISVNLSPIQLQNPRFLERVTAILTETKMRTEYLELEITESTLVQNFNQTIEILKQLSQQEVKIAIDDFGTGYSSLSVLKNLPVNILKIDRSFVQDITKEEDSAKLCQSIILLGKSLNLRVIAEGVELNQEADLLETLGCEEIQGYLMSPPVSSEDLNKLLKKTLPRGEKMKEKLSDLEIIKIAEDEEKKIDEIANIDLSLLQAYTSLKEELKYHNIREKIVMDIAQKIRQSLKVEDILNTTITEVRHLLNVDRVFLYQFDKNGGGTVVVESVSEPQYSILGEWIDEPCFREKYVKYYRQGRVKAIEDIKIEGLQNCHFELLDRYQVKSNLVLPIVHQDQLWGLLIAHHCQQTRKWEPQEVTLLHQLAIQIAIAIHQGELYQQLDQANLKLQQLSAIDGLTKIANRRRFDTYLEEQWNRLMRSQDRLSLILCDVDFFKQYNNTYGHRAGDECLQKIASVINKVIQNPDDLGARYGGKEFAIILPHTSVEEALAIACLLREEIKTLAIPHIASQHQIVTASFGVASLIPQVSLSRNVIIEQADQALYISKTQGRDRVNIL